jgi:hypothetical protein
MNHHTKRLFVIHATASQYLAGELWNLGVWGRMKMLRVHMDGARKKGGPTQQIHRIGFQSLLNHIFPQH